ncbi:MAG: homocysteine S-methyltransferase family protein [Planctomycetes bacterium]|nr:homocysteine S-methyltransferase family protein [Planctomycetota bacterium]
MTKQEFRKLIESRVVILDGATGTELAKQGMPQGVCPEQWVLQNPQAIENVQRAYREAGSDIVYACTFGGNRCKLEEFGLQDSVVEMNQALARLSKNAMGENGFVFGDIAPTGRFVEPFGDFKFDDAVEVYREQVKGLLAGGVDGFAVETMLDIQEARAALIAIKESCDLPVIVTMTYQEDGRTLTGTDPASALITLQSLGADAVGCNCSTGPAQMLMFIQAMQPYATVPLVAKPNAGMPKLVNGKTIFDMPPEEFGSYIPELMKAGACFIGGCCGTAPEYIREAKKAAASASPVAPVNDAISAVSSARKTVCIGSDRTTVIVGERINPTGKKKLQAELREGKLDLVRQYAAEQVHAGAEILDVNMGVSGIDERDMMVQAIKLLSKISDAPLCIDSTKPEVVEAALRLYPGRALLNSISCEKERIEKTLPIAAKYGAMFILLPLTDDEIPPTCDGRISVIGEIYAQAEKYGYKKADIVVDGLVMTVSSDQQAAKETISLVEWCASDFGVNTILGLSNVSFGLPERKWVNGAFLAMNIDRGLTMAIANPSDEVLMASKFAGDALIGKDKKLREYVGRFSDSAPAASAKAKEQLPPEEAVFRCVINGDQDNVVAFIKKAIEAGISADTLVNEKLIPAIQKVGYLFDQKKYFLPQLMMSADTMRTAFEFIEPVLRESGTSTQGPTVILATVKGDIHDIGKNLVALMLKNYSFKVIDLGKDVSAEEIVAAAEEHNADIIGLSALMTTTMSEMKGVIEHARQRGIKAKFMIGGAVVDNDYAEEIGAEGYAPDAIGAVKTAQRLSN